MAAHQNTDKEICRLKGASTGQLILIIFIFFGICYAIFQWNKAGGVFSALAAIAFLYYAMLQSSDLLLFDNYLLIKPQYFKRQKTIDKIEYSENFEIFIHQAIRGSSGFSIHYIKNGSKKKYGFVCNFSDYYTNVFKFLDSKKIVICIDSKGLAEEILNAPKTKLIERDKGYWGLFGYWYYKKREEAL